MIPKFRVWSEERQMMSKVWKITEEDDGGVEICSDGFKDGVHSFVYDEPVSDLKLMQSTGLTDKNGVEIFEGDVVIIPDYDDFPRMVVKYVQGTYCLFEDDNCLEALTDYYEDSEVIGNIYENPELVEEAQEK